MESKLWIIYGFLALILWGFWGFFPKLALKYMSAESVMFWEVLPSIPICLFVLINLGFKPEFSVRGAVFAFLTGTCGILGMLCLIKALDTGKHMLLVTLTALYPVISVILSLFFLKESLSATQWAGVALAFVSMALINFRF